MTQVGRDVNVHIRPVLGPESGAEVVWPVWVGTVPPLAAAFQPRTAVRKKIARVRDRGGNAALCQVLVGDGGVGKSQLAASLARETRDEEPSGEGGLDVLVWAKATEPDQIITAYAEAAERLHLPGGASDDSPAAAKVFLAWLAATERRWLVVLDDISDPEAVDEWWPDGNARNGWVLATTRRDDARLSGKSRTPVRLDIFSPEEARAFLRRRLTDAGHPNLFNPDDADSLSRELGHLPLALGHAAAYMINKRRTTGDYLRLFRDTDNRLGDLLPPDADTEGYGGSVTASLLISLTGVEAADTTRLARPLLQLISLVDPLGHPAALWTTHPALQYLRTARPGHRRWFRRHHPAVTEKEIRDALYCLRTYALITQDTHEAPIRVHALTARAIRETIPSRIRAMMARITADAIQGLWPDRDHLDGELASSLRANAMQLDQHTHPALWQPETHGLIYRVSSSLTEAVLYDQAVAYDQRTVQQSIAMHGPDHPETLMVRSNLANSYSDAGRTRDALELCERVLADCERVLGADHPDTLSARNNLANSYSDAGRTRDALELCERVLADYERVLGADHPDTLSARNNLANSGRPQPAGAGPHRLRARPWVRSPRHSQRA
ncbi:tetratricopeptide repeat protein [Streptomyces avicenniae]|uniref:tetratricopeptide repeat protein n=1 Tax=Streptomyces avicenniae TaxID=500153 RepID=UPI00167D9B9D|nr:tetratricopeptide repeat protein [Streptomyces avicenniae]